MSNVPAAPGSKYSHSLTVIAVFISIAFSILVFIEPELLTGKAVATTETSTTEEVSDLILHHTFVDNKDSSGNGNNMESSNAAATGQGVYLYGNGDSHVRVDEMNNFPREQLTMAFWMLAPGWGSSDQAFLSYSLESSPREVVLLYADKGLSFCIGGTCERLTNPQDNIGVRLFNNQWHHFAITWENERGEVRLYIDGQATGSTTSIVGRDRPLSTNGVLILGQKANNCKYPKMCRPERKMPAVKGGFTNSYNGYLADFRIYSTVKTEEEILGLVYPGS